MNIITFKPCPKCGKPMAEEPKFKGLWMCPDGKIRLNETAPFAFKCDGMKLTNAGVKALENELLRQHLLRN